MSWQKVLVQCPICDKRGGGRAVGGWIAEGQDSDLLVRVASGLHPVQVEIHTCKCCGYSGLLDDFIWMWPTPLSDPEWNKPPEISVAAKKNLSPDIERKFKVLRDKKDGSVSFHAGYEIAHRCAELLGADDLRLAELLVRAYWCLKMPPCNEAPVDYKQEKSQAYMSGAVRLFSRVVAKSNYPNYVPYLCGEFCRRLGKFEGSVAYFKLFLKRKDVPEYLLKAARALMKKAESGDCQDITMESLLYV